MRRALLSRALVLCVFLSLACAAPPAAPDGAGGPKPAGASDAASGRFVASDLAPPTVAEGSAYRETARHADVVSFLRDLEERSEVLHVGEIGRTEEGRSIPLALLSRPRLTTPEEATARGSVVVLVLGAIHGGEVDGKDALLALVRDLALAPAHPILDRLVLAVVPVYNADGNERIDRKNRGHQPGPEEGVGKRENARGLDLNRDFVKAEASETRALLGFVNAWNPRVVIDTHTTNGSRHRHPLTWSGAENAAVDPALRVFVREQILGEAARRLEASAGLATTFYGNFEAGRTRWETYENLPRYGVPYFGMRGRIAILAESYAYAPFQERVESSRRFVETCLQVLAEKAGILGSVAGGAATAPAGGAARRVALRGTMAPLDAKGTIRGFEEELREGKTHTTERPLDLEVELWQRFEAAKDVAIPSAYAIPADAPGAPKAVELLLLHGATVLELREDVMVGATIYRLDAHDREDRPFQGHFLARANAGARTEPRRLAAGSYLVPIGPETDPLVPYLLEPEAEDGFLAWGILGEGLAAGADWPVVRIEQETPMLARPTRPARGAAEAPSKVLDFDLYFARRAPPSFGVQPVPSVQWLPDGDHYLIRKGSDLVKVHAPTGRVVPEADPRTAIAVLQLLEGIDAAKAREIAVSPELQLSRDGASAVFEHAGDLWWFRRDGSAARRLTSTPDAEEELSELSPDGARVAFVRANDLYVVDVETGEERAITTGGSDVLRRGKADWVYFEELFGRSWKAFWWSPDSKRIAFLDTDATKVPAFTIVNDVPEPQRVETVRYPRVGEPNPLVDLRIADAATGAVVQVDLAGYPAEDRLVTGVTWWPDGSGLAAFVSNRIQTWLDVLAVEVGGGAPQRLLRDQTAAWTETPIFRALQDGTFLLSSERSGWKHLDRYARDGKLLGAVTKGPWEMRDLVHVDEAAGVVWVTAMADSPIAPSLYRVGLDGSNWSRLTSEPGSHGISPSPSGAWFVDAWSSRETPPVAALRRMDDGSLVRWIATNDATERDEFRLGTEELFEIETPDGERLQAALMKPADFDPSRRYPVWYTTYGGPHAPTILDRWSSGRAWDEALLSEGILVFRCDVRTASGRSVRSAWEAYRQLGLPELRDVETAIEWLRAQPFVDPERIGMEGHSYGGFLTALCMTRTKLFAAGIVGAPVTDWRDYDSIYTERYMRMPEENAAGYDATSVVKRAKDLHGRMLLIHGLMDDNVHLQHSTRFIDALQKAQVPFELMVYPGARHGIRGTHYQKLRADFILRTIGYGSRIFESAELGRSG